MMKNLEDRVHFWDVNHSAVQQGDSFPILFFEYLDLFKDKDVLEIGPGEGRQFHVVNKIAKSVVIADISAVVLLQKKYEDIRKLMLNSWGNEFFVSFDVIHFWYVLHHLLEEELVPFFGFIERHLRHRGKVLFNTPCLDYPENAYGLDGIKTTKFPIEVVREAFGKSFTILNEWEVNKNSTGFTIIGELQ